MDNAWVVSYGPSSLLKEMIRYSTRLVFGRVVPGSRSLTLLHAAFFFRLPRVQLLCCTLFIANWCASCQLGFLNTTLIYNICFQFLVLTLKSLIGGVVNFENTLTFETGHAKKKYFDKGNLPPRKKLIRSKSTFTFWNLCLVDGVSLGKVLRKWKSKFHHV